MSLLKELENYLVRLNFASPVGKIVRALIYPLIKGRLKYYTGWDDLRAPASGINPPGLASDPTMAEDGTLRFSSSAENLIAVLFQMPHAWKEGTGIRPHVHWHKTSDVAGDVAWEMRYRIIGVGSVPPEWSAWIPAVSRNAEPGSTQKHTIDGFGEIDLAGETLSCMVSFQVRRNPAAAKDDYAAPAAMLEFDAHYQKDGFGSFEEYVKGEV